MKKLFNAFAVVKKMITKRSNAEEAFVRKAPRLQASSVPPTLLLLTQKVVEASSQEVAAQPGMHPMHLGAATHPIAHSWERKGA